jgi:hypothetical protein
MAYGLEINWKRKEQGEEALKETLVKLRDEMNSAIALELDAIWQNIKELAIELCPKETGSLASSITLESEGGTGQIGESGACEFYSNAIYAGSDAIVNPKTGKPTSEYVLFVHEGHRTRSGEFWEGEPFLTEALDYYQAELERAVDRAFRELVESD